MHRPSRYITCGIIPGCINVIPLSTYIYNIPRMVYILACGNSTRNPGFPEEIPHGLRISLTHAAPLNQYTIHIIHVVSSGCWIKFLSPAGVICNCGCQELMICKHDLCRLHVLCIYLLVHFRYGCIQLLLFGSGIWLV